MKHKVSLFAVLLMAMTLPKVASAYDFSYTYQGKTLYYNIVDNHAEVVRPGTSSSFNNYITGDVIIPSTVIYNDTTYSVTTLGTVGGYGAFYNCSALTSITIPNSVTSFGSDAFANCSGLIYVNYLGTLSQWCNINFEHWAANPLFKAHHLHIDSTEVTNLTIPDSITIIKQYAFYGCSGLTSVSIPNTVTSIGGYAFCECSNLTSVNIPNSVTSIGAGAFKSCSSLTSVITIGDSVTSIGDNTFYGCSSLTTVTLGNSITSIGNSAFEECVSLDSVCLGNSLISIGEKAFYKCYSLHRITLPNTLTSIGSQAFDNRWHPISIGYNHFGLDNVSIPNSVTSIGNAAFRLVRHIEYHGNASGSPWEALSMNGVVDGVFVYSDSTKTTLIGYFGSGGAVTVDSTVTAIRASAFRSCAHLTSLVIPNPMTTLAASAFDGCYTLTSIDLPDSLAAISNSLFYYCMSLTSVTIPNTVTSIGNGAFLDCKLLTSIVIPNSVTSIGNQAFMNCDSLTSIVVPNTITTIPSEFAFGCKSLTSFDIPDSVTSIGTDAFQNCHSLTSITMPEQLASIGNGVFKNCYNLSAITIPAQITSLGTGTFYQCYRLTEIKCLPEIPPTLGSSVFYMVPDTIRIIVPCHQANCYALNWTNFSNFIEPPAHSFNAQSADSTMGYVDILAQPGCPGSQAVVKAVPSEGYRFTHWNDNNTNNPRTLAVTQDTMLVAFFETFVPTDTVVVYDTIYVHDTTILYDTLVHVIYDTLDKYIYDTIITDTLYIHTTLYIHDTVYLTQDGENFRKSIGGGFCQYNNDFQDPKTASFSSVTPSGHTLLYQITNGNAKVIWNNSYPSSISGHLIVPDSVTNDSVTYCVNELYTSCFQQCSSLFSIVLPNTLTSIGDYAFDHCSGLTSVTIPNGVTSIGNSAFSSCSGLTSVTIPNSVTSIGNWVFSSCSGLTSVTIGSSVTSIGEYAFYYCTGLTSITIPNSVTSIGYRAFFGCSGLTSVTIGSGVTSIGQYAFSNCTNLTTVTIGNSITSVGNNAFRNCTTITKIVCMAPTAPTLNTDAMSHIPATANIYIPCGSYVSYHTQWTRFHNIYEIPPYNVSVRSSDTIRGGIDILIQPICPDNTIVFYANANYGYGFTHWSDNNTDNPRTLLLTQDTSLEAYFHVDYPDMYTIRDTILINDHVLVTLYDTLSLTVHDTVYNYFYDTVLLTDTIYIYDDTIYIHDTIFVTGIDGLEAQNAKVYINNGQIVVEGAEGNRVTLYDVTGRVLATKQDNYTPMRFDAPASGTYLIKIGAYPARRVVVIR